MSLDPSPLSPTPTPLLTPTDPAPGRGAALVGALISVLLAVVVGFVSMHFGTRLIYLPAGIKADARTFQLATSFQVQGFNYHWVRSYSTSNSMGYQNDTVNKNILQSEAHDYHMNLVVITVVGDMNGDNANPPTISTSGADAYADSVYANVANMAKQYGLTPVFKLELRDVGSDSKQFGAWSGLIGSVWPASTELKWVDQYTAFATHYARLAQQLNMPFFIIGSELDQLTVDNPQTAGKPPLKEGDDPTCHARRDCEWRHIIAAVHNPSYQSLTDGVNRQGGSYTGKLIYAATSSVISGTIDKPEWQNITWWDALDYIGIDAFFPLLADTATSDIQIQSAWHHDASHGQLATGANGNGGNTFDLFAALNDLASHFGKFILFTGAGYESLSGSNGNPGNDTTGQQDYNEQLNDMQGLLETFSGQRWWLGVIWSSDYAVWPRDSLTNAPISTDSFFHENGDGTGENDWTKNTEWAGDCISASFSTCPDGHAPAKPAGVMLSQKYTIKPIPPQSG
jgi:hypothetical protein